MCSAITWRRGDMLSSRFSSKQLQRPVVGELRFGTDGELAQARTLQVQFRNVKTNDLIQFKDISTQVVVAPTEYESGKLIYPYEKALTSSP